MKSKHLNLSYYMKLKIEYLADHFDRMNIELAQLQLRVLSSQVRSYRLNEFANWLRNKSETINEINQKEIATTLRNIVNAMFLKKKWDIYLCN